MYSFLQIFLFNLEGTLSSKLILLELKLGLENLSREDEDEVESDEDESVELARRLRFLREDLALKFLRRPSHDPEDWLLSSDDSH